MLKDFDTWNIRKKELDNRNSKIFYYEREIWWLSAGINIGVEENGKNSNFERPFLIIRKFNQDMCWGLPLTSAIRNNAFYHVIDLSGSQVSVCISQIKTISSKRFIKKMGMLSEVQFSSVINQVQNLLLQRKTAR